MHLIKLVTRNFKRLGDFTAEFTAGLNVIGGDNFRGKSTLLKAIEVALWGAGVIPGKKDNIPTWGQKDFGLDLHFSIGDNIYVVTRNKSTGKLLQYGQGDNSETLIANGNTPVTAAIEQLLGLTAKDYSLFIQSKQHEVSGVLDFGATALNRKVEEFAGVDLIDQVQSAAQQRYTRLTGAAEARMPADDVIESSEKLVAQRADQVSSCESAVKEAHQALAIIGDFTLPVPTVNPSALRDERLAADRLWVRVEAADNAVPAAVARLEEAKARLAGLTRVVIDDLKNLRDAAQELGTEFADKVKAAQLKINSKASLASQLTEAQASAEKLKEAMKPNPGDAPFTAEQIEALEAEAQTASNAVATADVRVDQLAALAQGATCPTCGHVKEDHDEKALDAEIREAERHAAAASEASAVAAQKLRDAKASLRDHTLAMSAFERSGQDYAGAVARVDELKARLQAADAPSKAELERLEQDLEAARVKYSELTSQCKSAVENNQRYDAEQAALANAQRDHDAAQSNCETLNKQWEELPEPPTDEDIAAADRAHAAYEQARGVWANSKNDAQRAVDSSEADLRMAQSLLSTAQGVLNELLSDRQKAREDSEKAARCQRLVRFLRERRQTYLKQVWDVISGVSSHLVNQASRGAITRVISQDGEFFFEENGVLVPAVEASGAQKGLIGSSLRVGLARALYGSDALLIFDEPTESCSEENASALSAMLANSAKQVLLITHRETDQALAKNIINVG